MAEQAATETILKRMTRTGPEDAAPGAPMRVLGAAIARAAEALFGLPVAVTEVSDLGVTLADLGERIEDRALLTLVEGDGERLGLAALSSELFSALIEMLTTGRLATGTFAERRPTRTDAALCSEFVDRVMTEADALAPEGDSPWEDWEGRFRYASCVEDARLLALLMEDTRYRLYRAAFTLGGGGTRSGLLTLALPERQRAQAAPDATVAQAAEWQGSLVDTVLEARAGILAVLARVQQSVSELVAMQEGSLLRLPDDAFSSVRIEGAGGRLVSLAKLGQYRGYLAVRLTGAPDLAREAEEFAPATAATEGTAVVTKPGLSGADQARDGARSATVPARNGDGEDLKATASEG